MHMHVFTWTISQMNILVETSECWILVVVIDLRDRQVPEALKVHEFINF